MQSFHADALHRLGRAMRGAGMRMRTRAGVVAIVVMVAGGMCSVADAAGITPGWECVPATAGQAVVSGGTGSSPSCGSGTTAVLAPTYVSSGVGGQPTVEFSGVNVQIVDGSGSTSSVNGSGNLVLGYDESPGTQSGSHDLILGEGQDYTGYGDLIAGHDSTITGDYDASFGENNRAPGSYTLVAGDANVAGGAAASAMGGYENHASSPEAAVLGGCGNIAGSGTVSVASSCTNQSSDAGDFATISGGVGNQTGGVSSAIAGGQFNLAADPLSFLGGGCDGIAGSGKSPKLACDTAGVDSVLAGDGNLADANFAAVSGGEGNQATGAGAAVSGGGGNLAASPGAAISGGLENYAQGSQASISGGYANQTTNTQASVAGGQFNIASDQLSFIGGGCDNLTGTNATQRTASCPTGLESILGGQSNEATGQAGAITGGQSNQATGQTSAIAGGQDNQATGQGSSVSGGEYNLASDLLSFIAGGCDNITGGFDPPSDTCATSGLESVLGGDYNAATGVASGIDGGESNLTQDPYSFVVGGCLNTAGYMYSQSGQLCSSSGLDTVLGGAGEVANSQEAVLTGAPPVGGYNFSGTVDEGDTSTLFTLPNGTQLLGNCGSNSSSTLTVEPQKSSDGLDVSGTLTNDGTVSAVEYTASSNGKYSGSNAPNYEDLNVSAYDPDTDEQTDEIHVHMQADTHVAQCDYEGIVIPSQ